MKKWSRLLPLALVVCVIASPALGTDAPDVLGILEIRGLDRLAAAAFELSKAAGQPVPKEAAALALYGALGTMPGLGIQPYEKVRALWLAGGSEKGNGIVLLPVENEGAEYLEGLDQTGWTKESETADGLLHYTPSPQANVLWDEVYFLKYESTLIAGRTADGVRQAAAAMASLPPILPAEGTVAIQIRPAAVIAAFGPQIAEKLNQGVQGRPGTPKEAAAMAELYVRSYLAAARQVDEIVLGVGVADGNLNIHTRAAPVAGTTLANWLATVGTPAAAAAVVNLPGALAAETMHLGDLNLLAPAYFGFIEQLMKIMPQEMGPEAIATYMDAAKAYWKLLSGDIGIALLPPTGESPLRFAEFVALKDPAAARALTTQLVQSVNEMMKAMSGGETAMPVQVELATGEPREYREITVDRLTYRLTPGDEIKGVWPKGIPTELALEIAWVPGGLLACAGDAALTDALVDGALDGVGAPVSDLPSWKAFYPTPESPLVDLSHVAIFDAIRAYVELYDSKTGGQNAEYVPAGPGSLDSLSYLAMGGLMSRVRFSLADIGAVSRKIQEVQQKVMSAMVEQMQMQGGMPFEDEDAFAPMADEEFEEWSPDAAEEEVDEVPAPPETE